jgi:hypothetical protein
MTGEIETLGRRFVAQMDDPEAVGRDKKGGDDYTTLQGSGLITLHYHLSNGQAFG